MTSPKLIKLSDFFNLYSRSRIKPTTIGITKQKLVKKFKKYRDLLDEIDVWSTGSKREQELELNLNKAPFNRNKIKWDNLWPFEDFGWTASHLRPEESDHFEIIEYLFRNPTISNDPQDWKGIKERAPLNPLSPLIPSGTSGTKENKLVTGPSSRPDLFVVQFPTKGTFVLHEYLVGKVVCNYLRTNLIPNYPYYFGVIHCSKPVFDSTDKLISWCQNQPGGDIYSQVAMENIYKKSVTLLDVIRTEPQYVLNLFYQQ